MKNPAILILEDKTIFYGSSIGSSENSFGEIVFNTAMTGYQEILTDPSYKGQIVTFTYPHIGNTGINDVDVESKKIQVKGIIIHNISLTNSNYRSTMTLSHYLKKNNIVGICNIDTRRLTKILRERGTQYGYILNNINNINIDKMYEYMLEKAHQKQNDLVEIISTKKIYTWDRGTPQYLHVQNNNVKIKKLKFHVIVYDFGVKESILRTLVDYSCRLTIVPSNTSAEHVLSLLPDGILLSNGPGDPRSCTKIINHIKQIIKNKIPIFGICLGHQILALANQAEIIKMNFGHHGSNHPVQDLQTKQVMITSQNHNFTINKKNLPKNIIITHQSLFDQSIQGFEILNQPFFGFQGHPEASPGPHDCKKLFKKFIENIQKYKTN